VRCRDDAFHPKATRLDSRFLASSIQKMSDTHVYGTHACSGKDFRDGAVVPFEWFRFSLAL
jgi:hypothetical protein